jgi:hypothetical protein
MTAKNTRVYEGGPNVFADLGLFDADNHFLKAQIVAELYRLISERKLTQPKAGDIAGHFASPKCRGCSRATSGNTRLTA